MTSVSRGNIYVCLQWHAPLVSGRCLVCSPEHDICNRSSRNIKCVSSGIYNVLGNTYWGCLNLGDACPKQYHVCQWHCLVISAIICSCINVIWHTCIKVTRNSSTRWELPRPTFTISISNIIQSDKNAFIDNYSQTYCIYFDWVTCCLCSALRMHHAPTDQMNTGMRQSLYIYLYIYIYI